MVLGLGALWRNTVRSGRSEEHTSELQSLRNLVCRLLLEKKKKKKHKTGLKRERARLCRLAASTNSTRCVTASVFDILTLSFFHVFLSFFFFFFFNDTATTEIYTLSLHDALPIYPAGLLHLQLRSRVGAS